MSRSEQEPHADATGIDRREFLRLSSAVAAAGALASAGCQVPQETTVPFHDMPENLVDGLGPARLFRTVLDGAPVSVKTREGRPVLVTPVAGHSSVWGLSVRHHAALMDLYDPDRARGPLSVRRSQGAPVASSWNAIGADLVDRLKRSGSKAVLLTGSIDSPAVLAGIAMLEERTGMRHVAWSPLASPSADEAWSRAFGTAAAMRPRLEQADLIIGLGAEFLDHPEQGFEGEFSARRSPDGSAGRPMNRFVQFEGRLTLTGANADRRIRVRDSQMARIGAALAHELIVKRSIGPLAGDATVASALGEFAIDAIDPGVGVSAVTLRSIANEMAAAPGRCVVMAGGTASCAASGPAIELTAAILNLTLGAMTTAQFAVATTPVTVPGSYKGLAALVEQMRNGQVELLIVAGVNPVYDAPASLNFAESMSKVAFTASFNDRLDETSRHADTLAPVSHPFESWSDAALPGGIYAVQQPVIQPLHDTRGLLDVLVDLAAALGAPAAMAAVANATSKVVPAAATAQPAPPASLAWHFVRSTWAQRFGSVLGSPEFESAWHELLRSGAWQGNVPSPAALTFNTGAMQLLEAAKAPVDGVELQLYPHAAVADGRSGNNGWLHELPDPITRMTWGGALSIAPRRFDQMQLTLGDLIEVDAGFAKIVAPAYRHAGMHEDQVALPLGLGRSACGAIGAGIGVNAFTMRPVAGDRLLSAGLPVKLRKVEGREPIALAQGSDVIDRERRPLVPVTTLSKYESDPKSGTEQEKGGPSAWPAHEYPKAKWAMAIDLSKCTGCAKCVIGCQAENNIPVVGRQGMLDGREMSWLRIDRYYDAPPKEGGWDAEVWDGPLEVVEEPETMFEPMLCQHCENAPCETVCPFSATMHSEDGLNQQVYNRCVGTRYCANNCPFKVRRFNYWELSKPQDSSFFRWLVPRVARNAELNTREPMQMKNNPEVTVRSRGVMEKCSFCVQRIRGARAEAGRNGASKDQLADGAVVPACMEACGTGAITFGDINTPGARVAEMASHPRAMKLLDSLGVKPAVSYLTKVRNDKA